MKNAWPTVAEVKVTDLTNVSTLDTLDSAKRSNKRKNEKEFLTAKRIKSLIAHTRAAKGQRITIWDLDEESAGFGVRITDKHLSYIFGAKFPGSTVWTRREIGACGEMSLADARTKAKSWKKDIQKGIDPRTTAAQEKEAEDRKRADTFRVAAEEYIKDRVLGTDPNKPLQRNGKDTARIIRKVFIAAWKVRPIVEINRRDVLVIIKAKKRLHPVEARTWLSVIKTFFMWALNQEYGLERSPCSDIMAKDAIGDKKQRKRVLNDDEVAALWRAAEQPAFKYPVGPIYHLLTLSGLRLNEVAKARRREFDLAKRQWIVPAERMKGKNDGPKEAQDHLVPLTAPMLKIIEALPRFKNSDLLFSTTQGRVPVAVGSKVKADVDTAMLVELRKIAAARGDDPAEIKGWGKLHKGKPLPLEQGELERWVNHDIRRTVRTNLSAIKDANGRKVPKEVKEAVLAHKQGGIAGVYDVYEFSDEKREALELWNARLHELVFPPLAPAGGRKAAS
jgi:integrase